jgi:hypothetical protein
MGLYPLFSLQPDSRLVNVWHASCIVLYGGKKLPIQDFQEECMRIESQLVPQTLVESSKPLDKKEIKSKDSGEDSSSDASIFSSPAPFGSSGTYSVSSLKAAVDYHVKFLSVAENNMMAVNHPPTIPRALIEQLNRLQNQAV